MKNIEINISNKIATLKEKFVGVCGNSDYVVVFDFDDEWKSHATKTARFKYNGKYEDVVFTGNECPMPVILDASSVEIGVYAGNLHTTTPACVLMKTCILSGSGVPADPTPDVYNQIIDKIDAGMLKGEDGVSPSVEVSKSGDTTTIAITDASGVHTAEIKDGSKGDPGADGAPGAKGDKGDKGEPGKDGSDANVTAENIQLALGYAPVTPSDLAAKQDVLTDADKQSITKTGMTTGAAWTVEEQAAACERMNAIYNVQCEETPLINVTLEETTPIVKIQLPKALTHIKIQVTAPEDASDMLVYIYLESDTTVQLSDGVKISASNRYMSFVGHIFAGMLFSYWEAIPPEYMSGSFRFLNKFIVTDNFQTIEARSIVDGYELLAGTNIQIWGG